MIRLLSNVSLQCRTSPASARDVAKWALLTPEGPSGAQSMRRLLPPEFGGARVPLTVFADHIVIDDGVRLPARGASTGHYLAGGSSGPRRAAPASLQCPSGAAARPGTLPRQVMAAVHRHALL